MSDETYNGWTNYPTWAVNLWLSNEQDLCNTALALTAEMIAEPYQTSKYWDTEQTARYNVADRLKDFVENDLAPDLGATFAADLLGYALGLVNWNEIADAFIEAVSEQAH